MQAYVTPFTFRKTPHLESHTYNGGTLFMLLDSTTQQNFAEIEKQLAKIDASKLQHSEQLLAENSPAAGKWSEGAWWAYFPKEQEHQPTLLHPKCLQPRSPPRQKKEGDRQELLRRFNPFPPQKNITVTDYQNEILNMCDMAQHEGEESKGGCFIRWRFIRELEKGLAPNVITKIWEKVRTVFSRLLLSLSISLIVSKQIC